ncbi:DUF5809 family protein [Halorubrum sp. DTA98]|uniref:DUF5809 family protein n=1 Tax=Halorubrum sp. DTA98 TaxID=3402163 RepID=UPI003AAE76C5
MHTKGAFAPTTRAEALERYEDAGPAARVVVRETTKAMEFDADEYDERVRPEVIETARDAIFAELLAVHVGDRSEFEDWLAESGFAESDVVRLGSEHVDRVAWHAVPFADAVIATTFQDEPEAAVGTLRRNAFGRVYRDEFYR